MNTTRFIIDFRFQLGSNIRQLRKEQQLSQEQLGLMVGRDRSYISRIECGRCSATVDTIFLIADGLGISGSELLAGIGEPSVRKRQSPMHFSTRNDLM